MGIEALLGAGIGDLLGLGGGAAAADAGIAGAAGADVAGALAGPTVAGTALDTLGGGAALTGTGADVASTAGSALGLPDLVGGGGAAGGFGAPDAAATAGGISGALPGATDPLAALTSATPTTGFGTTAASDALPASVSNAFAQAPAGATAGGAPGATGSGFAPGTGTAAGAASAPAGIGAPPDATSFVGNTSVGGAPLSGQPGVAPAAAGAPQSTSIGDLLSKAGSGAVNSITNNPLGIALGAAGLGANILAGSKATGNEKALEIQAGTALANENNFNQQGQALQQYLQSGKLPPQYQTQVDQAIQDAKTAAISNAAAQGQSTDPRQNTSLQQALDKIDQQKPQLVTNIAQSLFQSGSTLLQAGQSAAGLSGELFKALVQNDTTQAANTGKAIASLAAALAGKSQATLGGTNIQVSQA